MSDQLDTGRCYHAVIYPWISTSWTLIACHRARHLRSPSLIHPKSISQLFDFVWIRFSRCFLAIKMLVNKHVTDQLFGRIPWPLRCTLEIDPTVLNSNLSLTRKKISLDKTRDNTPLHPLLRSSHCHVSKSHFVKRCWTNHTHQVALFVSLFHHWINQIPDSNLFLYVIIHKMFNRISSVIIWTI